MITYPLDFPTPVPARIVFTARSVVGIGRSPFSGAQQVYAHPGMWLDADVEFPPMERADAEEVIAFLLALNGTEGTFLMGDPAYSAPRGTWDGSSPKASGANAAQSRVLVVNNLALGLTAKKGDMLQIGSGTTSRLYKVVTDSVVGGSPLDMRLDIWPALREAPADGDAIVVNSPKGCFRLKDNSRQWNVGEAKIYGVSFSCTEAL